MDERPKVTQRKCECCDCETEHKYMFSKNDCHIWKCISCGTGHTEVNAFAPESYYTEDYFNGTYVDGYSNYVETEEALRVEFSKTLRYLNKYAPTGGKLLEIGCAYGFFLNLAQDLYDVYGVEISAKAVDECHKRGLSQVHAGVLSQDVLDIVGSYDALVMLDVIEHLEEPKKILATAASQLKSGGIALLTTGDYSSIQANLFRSSWRLMTPPQHMWFFSVAGISKMAKTMGFEVLSISHPWKFVPLSLVIYQAMRMLRIPPRNFGFISKKLFLPINLFDAIQVVLKKI